MVRRTRAALESPLRSLPCRLRRFHPDDRGASRRESSTRLRAIARERRRLSRQVRGMVLHPRRDLLARIEARRWTVPHLRPRGAVDLGGRLVFSTLGLSDRLIDHFRRHPRWVAPRSVYNEMMAILEEGLDDLSISRTNFDWGVPIPGGGVIYVWLDALLNYITAIGWSEDNPRFHTWWPAQVQLVGKEIARFHTIIWPALLWALGEAAPELVFAHGWITVDGQKMSKSLGNTVDPFALAER